MRSVWQIFASAGLLFLAGFAAFGFVATFEYAEAKARLPWQIAYSVMGCGCGAALIRLWISSRSPRE